jgi:hypothetical protein
MPVQPQLQDLIDSIDREGRWEAPVQLQQFAKEETFHQQGGRERRRFRRYSLITNVFAVPIDEELCPVGPAFVALSSGMSVDGMRLIHTQPSPSNQLFLEIDGQPVRFVLSVLRIRPVGNCFEIAGRLTSAAVLNRNAALNREAVLNQREGSQAVVTTNSCATHDRSEPTHDDFLHWAGVTAAVPLLKAPRNGCGR